MTLCSRLGLIGCVLVLFTGSAPLPVPVSEKLLLADDPLPLLSAYHLYADVKTKTPNPQLVPYALSTALFSDYALKQRYVYIPQGKSVAYSTDGVLNFPVGTVLVKSFAYPADMRLPDSNLRVLETRLLIRKAAGWEARPYVWNADGSDAVLKRTGTRMDVNWIHTDSLMHQIN